MKNPLRLKWHIVVLTVMSILSATWFFTGSDTITPPPMNTIVVEEDDRYDKKLEWIEQMHLAAPDVNWRKMDMDFRLKRANDLTRNQAEQVIYGKWKEIGSNNQAGRTLVAEFDSVENQLYVASDGGQVWKGGIGTDDWISLTDHLKIPAIHFIRNLHMEDTDRLLIGSGMWNNTGILYSDDGGVTWEQATGLEDIISWGHIKRTIMKKDPYEGMYVLALQWDYDEWLAIAKIYVSYDAGESFVPLASFPYTAEQIDIWTDRFSNDAVFVLDKNMLYTLDEFGVLEFIGEIEAGEPDKVYLTGALNESYSLYAMQRRNGLSEFYASTDEGENWTYQSNLNFGPFMINSFKASPVTPGLLYFGGVNAFYSTDHGLNWNLVNEWWEYYDYPETKLHADIPSFDSFIDEQGNETLFINTDGGVYISNDDLTTVDNLSMNNLRISQYYSSYTCRFAPKYTHAGSQDQGYQFSDQGADDDVLDYEQIISGDYASIVSGDEGASVWTVYPTFAMYLPDANNGGGLRFWNFIGENYQWLPQLMADPDDPASVYIAGGRITSGAHLIHLTYSSGQMSYTEEPFDFSNGTNATISAMALSPINSDYRYVYTTEKDFFYSLDGGDSWTHSEGFEGPGSHYFYGAAIEPSMTTPGLVYVAGSGYSNPPVYVSTDHGVTFSDFSTGLPGTLIFDLALSPDDSLLFAASEIGAFVCKTWEGIWYDLGDSILPDQAFWAVDYVPVLQGARFSTYGRGIWEFDRNPDVDAGFEADILVVEEGNPVQFTDLSKWNPTTWNWTFEGGIPESSTDQNPEVIYPESGLFDVRLVVSNESSTDTLIKEDYIEVLEVTSLANETQTEFELFPNPAKDHITIKTDQTVQRIEIWDSRGSLVKAVTPDQGNNTRVNINNLLPGSYFVRLHTTNGVVVKRMVKY